MSEDGYEEKKIAVSAHNMKGLIGIEPYKILDISRHIPQKENMAGALLRIKDFFYISASSVRVRNNDNSHYNTYSTKLFFYIIY